MEAAEEIAAALAAKFMVLFPHLDERQRRLLMAAEARAFGHGGIRLVARAAGVREGTVSLGVTELDSGEAPLGRVRRVGGGRKRVVDQEVIKRLIKECVEEAVGYIVAAMTEPAVAALEGMAADLVVQLGSMALGFQDGVDLDQTKNAAKDGFNDGVQSGKEALHLASAGSGPGGGTGLVDLHIEHSEHTRAGISLSNVSTTMHGKTTSHLTKAKSHHGRTRGRDSIAQAIAPAADKAMAALVKATKAMGDHVGTTLPKAVKLISTGHKKNDDAIHDSFNRLKKNGSGGGRKGPGVPGSGVDHRKSEADIRTKPDALRGAKDDPRRNGIPLNGKTCKTDPIDVATGEMNLPQTDLSLPGTLLLTLIRTHLSEYRYGHWFGRSWASTLDERLESDPLGGGLIWAREDGSLLVYPRFPQAGGDPVLPLEGPRLPLSYSEEADSRTTLRIGDPQSGTSRYFTGSPYSASPAYWLTEIEDRNGNGITIARSDDGAPRTVNHDGGYQVQVSTSRGRIARLQLHTPAAPVTVMTYGYDERGNLNAVTNSSGLPLTFTYDDHDRITSWTDRNSSTFRYVYDSVGRVVQTIGPDGYMSSSFTYDTANHVTRYTDATGATTTFQLNELLQVVATTDPLGHTTHTAYDAYDRLLSQTDPLGRTTTVEYDESGRPTALIRPDGHRTTATYNSLGLPATLTEPDGATWQHTYDDRGNRTALTDPAGATTTYACNGRGALTAVTDPLGQTVRIGRTPAGLVATLTDPAESVTTHTYDPFGRLATLTDPLGSTTYLTWSVEGLQTSRTGPSGDTERWAYDGEGNCTAHTNASGQVTASEYTHFDLPAARTTPNGIRFTFGHDSELRLTTVTNPQGLTWTYTYDAAGQLVSETDFDGRTISYAYDPTGLLSTRVNAMGQNTLYSYDDVGNLVEKTVAGHPVRYAHDPCGRLLQAVGQDSVLEYSYDAVGRVVSESIDGRTVATTCDAAGRRTGRTTPSGSVTAYTYDTAGHRATLTAAGRTFAFTHSPVGREIERTLADVFTLTHSWDPAGRPDAQILTSPGSPLPLQKREYTYGPGGRLTAVTDQRAGRRSFTLDTTGRVTAVDAAGWSERYAYDEAGNQTHASWPDALPAAEARGERSYIGTRITRAGAVRYEYDAQGRAVLRQKPRLSRKPDTWRYTWDAEDRLTGVTTPDGTRWRYRYDPLGRRIAKQRLSPDGTGIAEETLFAWDGTTLAEQTTRVAGNPAELSLTWDHDGYKPLAQVESKSLASAPQDVIDQRFFGIVTDQIGTPTELVDESGHIAWHSRSTLWGTTVWNRDATAYTPLRFPGQYFDAETELHHNYFRHYDPETARYLTLDPLGLDPAPNPATYVDNPHTLSDPLGLTPCDENDLTWGGLVSYSTGPGGRAGTMHVSIRPHMTGGKTRPRVRGGVAGWESGKGYNRTHLLGAQIGGSNKDPRNFVTMHAYANTPVMVHIENQIRDAVDRGETIEYTVTPIYRTNNATDLIPVGLTLEVNGSRGFQFRPYEGQDFKSDVITILNLPKR
ncbi:DUF6531 domain-containing protein [Streptomyces sp. NPDC058619]|uniref:DUF6531 domain-containing protein n=1 Tax=unclassified Streptomyces TaxID=2593676 RepID=UPI0036528F2E